MPLKWPTTILEPFHDLTDWKNKILGVLNPFNSPHSLLTSGAVELLRKETSENGEKRGRERERREGTRPRQRGR
jgi:hypothetical protein